MTARDDIGRYITDEVVDAALASIDVIADDESCFDTSTQLHAVLPGILAAHERDVLVEAAEMIDRGPSFSLPPSVISELLREKAAAAVSNA